MLELYTNGELAVEIEIAELTDEEYSQAIDAHLAADPDNEFKVTGFVL